jgi:hypothetical protein
MTAPQATFGYDLDNDVRAVEAMAASLVPYVYDDELYGMLPGTLPRLTVGSLLMRLHRLHVITDLLTARQQGIVVEAQRLLDEARQAWHVAYTGKLKREFKARADALDQYFSEGVENPRAAAEHYPSAMEKRVMIEHLYGELEALGELTDAIKSRLPMIDNAIRRFVETDAFRWDARLERAYPSDMYWFLYRRVVVNK